MTRRPGAVPERVVVQYVHDRSLQGRFQVAGGQTAADALGEVWTDDTYNARTLGLANATVLDIGANLGAFSVLACRLGARRVYAYEPNPETAEALRLNIVANGVDDRVVVHEQAVVGDGHDRGYGWLVGEGGGAHLAPGADPLARADPGVNVELIHVADAVANARRQQLVMKIDCEGAEQELVAAMFAGELLDQAHVAAIVMEFHGPRMPHLGHLDVADWAAMVTQLAQYGRLMIYGRPEWGGLAWWSAW